VVSPTHKWVAPAVKVTAKVEIEHKNAVRKRDINFIKQFEFLNLINDYFFLKQKAPILKKGAFQNPIKEKIYS
jgi:hypothetical protein